MSKEPRVEGVFTDEEAGRWAAEEEGAVYVASGKGPEAAMDLVNVGPPSFGMVDGKWQSVRLVDGKLVVVDG